MNHAFGIKRYILNEDAVIPSEGYDDASTRMWNKSLLSLMPWNRSRTTIAQPRPTEEMKRIILSKDSVKEAIASIVKEKLIYYRNTLQLEMDENKIYTEVEKQAL